MPVCKEAAELGAGRVAEGVAFCPVALPDEPVPHALAGQPRVRTTVDAL